jgi:hypothetical protein
MDEGVERLKQLKMEQIRDQQNTPCSRCAKPALSHRSASSKTPDIRIPDPNFSIPDLNFSIPDPGSGTSRTRPAHAAPNPPSRTGQPVVKRQK